VLSGDWLNSTFANKKTRANRPGFFAYERFSAFCLEPVIDANLFFPKVANVFE
jgi:hypothetical protein